MGFLAPLLTVIALMAAPASADSAGEPYVDAPVVMELFTSEGCSACPKANKYVAAYGSRQDFLPLTFAVDYWDYLGWRDTHARPEFAERQRAYADRFGLSGPYTPQIVVMGADESRASTRGRIEAAVQRAGLEHPATARVSARRTGEGWAVSVSGSPTDADVWAVAFRPGAQSVKPSSGLNAGREMTLTNVATGLVRQGEGTGGDARFDLSCASACAILVQEKNGGAIIGAARIDS